MSSDAVAQSQTSARAAGLLLEELTAVRGSKAKDTEFSFVTSVCS